MKVEFNINDNVQVKLTDYGRECLRKNYKSFVNTCGYSNVHTFKLPEEDKNGYSTWQMWYLMQELGEYCYNGCRLPFEPTVKLDIK